MSREESARFILWMTFLKSAFLPLTRTWVSSAYLLYHYCVLGKTNWCYVWIMDKVLKIAVDILHRFNVSKFDVDVLHRFFNITGTTRLGVKLSPQCSTGDHFVLYVHARLTCMCVVLPVCVSVLWLCVGSLCARASVGRSLSVVQQQPGGAGAGPGPARPAAAAGGRAAQPALRAQCRLSAGLGTGAGRRQWPPGHQTHQEHRLVPQQVRVGMAAWLTAGVGVWCSGLTSGQLSVFRVTLEASIHWAPALGCSFSESRASKTWRGVTPVRSPSLRPCQH